MPSAPAETTPALERTLGLLEPEARAQSRVAGGYLHLLPAQPPRSTGPAQELMLSRGMALIYERWWRPALGRLVKGLFGPSMDQERQIAENLLRPAPGDRLLDVACGPGNFSRHLSRTVGREGLVVGIDVSEPMLARAVAEASPPDLGHLAYVRGDAQELPFVSGSFDAVCCFAALHLFSDPMRALDRMRDVLRAGGRIALFTSVRRAVGPPRAAEPLAQSLTGVRIFGRGEIAAALERRGFVEIEQQVAGATQFVGGRLA